jgi:hypothetical protein
MITDGILNFHILVDLYCKIGDFYDITIFFITTILDPKYNSEFILNTIKRQLLLFYSIKAELDGNIRHLKRVILLLNGLEKYCKNKDECIKIKELISERLNKMELLSTLIEKRLKEIDNKTRK